MQKFGNRQSVSEIFSPNSWYGSAKILKKYSGWKLPLPYVVPHAPGHSTFKTWDAELNSNLPCYYLFPAWRKRSLEKRTNKKIILGSSPWIYLLKMMNQEKNTKKRKAHGSIVFPPHSTHLIQAEMDHEKFIRNINKLGKEFFPISVCFYWRDIELKKHLIYQKKGFRVVCAGHMFNENFFKNLLNIFQGKKYLITNNYGSHIFYGSSAGLKVLFDKTINYSQSAPQEILQRDTARPDLSIYSHIDSIFCDNQDYCAQKKFSLSVLGANYFKSRFQLFSEILFIFLKNPFFFKQAIKHYKNL